MAAPQTIDDSLFALILRFAGFNQELSFNPDEFLKKQLQEIKTYVDQFRPEERGIQAIEWVEQYASEYRKNWNNEIVTREALAHKCPDCPLKNKTATSHCEIHTQWVELLQKYTADEISSREYVENALALLAEHKEDLRVKLSDSTL
jgi:transketolase